MQARYSGGPIASLSDVKGRPIPMPFEALERLDDARRAALVQRAAAEFREMPGLVLSLQQASRLLGVDVDACERILATLVGDGLLRQSDGGLYCRRDIGA